MSECTKLLFWALWWLLSRLHQGGILFFTWLFSRQFRAPTPVPKFVTAFCARGCSCTLLWCSIFQCRQVRLAGDKIAVLGSKPLRPLWTGLQSDCLTAKMRCSEARIGKSQQTAEDFSWGCSTIAPSPDDCCKRLELAGSTVFSRLLVLKGVSVLDKKPSHPQETSASACFGRLAQIETELLLPVLKNVSPREITFFFQMMEFRLRRNSHHSCVGYSAWCVGFA